MRNSGNGCSAHPCSLATRGYDLEEADCKGNEHRKATSEEEICPSQCFHRARLDA